jgi:hypothetical protein
MATGTLVNLQIDEGAKLLAALRTRGFDVIVACWMKGDEEEFWYLYIASSRAEGFGLTDAYRELHTVIRSTPDLAIDPFVVRMIGPTNPLVAAINDLRRRLPAPLSTRIGPTQFAGRAIEGAYIYP